MLFSAWASCAQSPVEFIENKGQWGDWFQYRATTSGADIMLEKDGFRYILGEPSIKNKVDSFHLGQIKQPPLLKFHVYKVTFEGANTHAEITGKKPQTTYNNYFLGNDSTRWKSGIHPCLAVDYTHLYDGIDMHVSSDKGYLMYEFMVQPKADAGQIKMRFDGQTNLKLKNGKLTIHTTVGDIEELKPYVYQYVNDQRVDVPCDYQLTDNILTFNFPNDYDHSQLLVIDPTVVFCTLTGSTADNWGFTATYDAEGDFYAGGLVNTLAYGGSFPVTTGAFQTTFGGGYTEFEPGTGPYTGDEIVPAYAADISIIKYNPTCSGKLYATYIGGSGNDHTHSMIVDATGNLIIAGRTKSLDYPTTSTAYQTTNNGGWDIVVTKLTPDGSSLVGSTYIGGTSDDGMNGDSTEYWYGGLKYNYGDDARSEVQVDNTGSIFMAGSTRSTNFPTTPTAISTTLSGLQDGVVFKLNNDLSSLIWSTYVGGNGDDAAYVLAFDTGQAAIYVAGGTNSTDLPVTSGSLHSTYQGDSADGFVLKFKNSSPYNVLKGTYVGTSHYDQVYGIQVSSDNSVYVMGQSVGGAFPVTSGTYANANSCQFAMKMDADLSTDLISTVFGNSDAAHTNISPVAFLVDTCNNVYISGWGGDLGIAEVKSGLCTDMPLSTDAFQSTTDGRDFYFIVLGADMSTLRYATYYGRSSPVPFLGEHVDGGTSRFDKHGIIYQAICANCGGPSGPAFPTTDGAFATLDGSPNCNEAALKIAFNIGPVSASITAGPSTDGCAPLTVNFTNTSNNALSFLWNWGDGSGTDTGYAPSHTFTTPGVYTVTLSAANSNACFRTTDTAHLTITVSTDTLSPAFDVLVTDSCGPYTANFINTSVYGTEAGAAAHTTFTWHFGDGTTFTGVNPPMHTYADTGIYTITLLMVDTTACNSPDSVSKKISIHGQRVTASFSITDSVCEGVPIGVINTSTNVITYIWNFGNGTTSTSSSPIITFDTVGTFTITLITVNPGACNLSDTVHATITVESGPTANFTYTPITPVPNSAVTFTNLSLNATSYSWDFGDATTSTEANPVHMYNKTGGYNVCLNAYNGSNCPARICKTVPTDIEPIIGLPSGFSPNGDGENDVLYVRGAAIKTLDLKIYNRWGELVFETTSQSIGWDGTFNGKPQPIDAYAFVLSVSFIDGSQQLKKGNVTLLR